MSEVAVRATVERAALACGVASWSCASASAEEIVAVEAAVPDLSQLEVFLRIVEEQGIGRAARRLGVSQPHVSQDLKRLEGKLGHRLVERDGKSIRLTPDGEALAVFARSMLAVAERTRSYFSRPRSRGLIRVGLTEELAQTGLARVLALFMRAYPGFRIEVETSFDSAALLRGIREARYDLVIGKTFGPAGGDAPMRVPLAWFGRADMHGAMADPISLVAPPASEARTIMLDRLNTAGRTWVVTFQSSSFACLAAAVRAGFGIAPTLATMDVSGTRILDDAGLPEMPDATMFVEVRPSVTGVEEFGTIVREAMLQLRR